jgi:hypothetical protein
MFPVAIHLKKGKELGNEEGKALGTEYFHVEKKEVQQSLLQFIIGDLILTLGGLHVKQAVKYEIWVEIQNLL